MELAHEKQDRFEFDVISTLAQSEEQERLLNKEFGVPIGSSFLDDFPVWKNSTNLPSLKIGVYQFGKLISTASIRAAELKTKKGNTLPIGIIGAVATDNQWHGCGAASQAVSLALLWAKEKKIPLVVLWGSEHSLYQKLGFELCGAQWRIPFSDLSISAVDSSPPSDIQHGWNDSLFSLIKQRELGLFLSQKDLTWFSSHKNVRWWWTQSATGYPTSYVAIGRGIDLKEIVHEWGGDKTELFNLLHEIKKSGAAKEIIGPKYLFNNYGINIAGAQPEHLCLARALDPVKIFSSFRPADRQALPNLASTEMSKVLFGPGLAGRQWNKHLPLPLWFWGLDSA